MNLKQWIGALLAGIGIGLFIFIFIITQNLFTSSYKAFVITSGSMEPKVPVGSVVLTKTKPVYQTGDIISFKSTQNPDEITTHRLRAIEGQNFVTKGDINEDPDRQTITSGQIIGNVYFTIPYLGYLADFAKTPKGFVAMIIIPASIIIYEEFKTILITVKGFLNKLFKNRGVLPNKKLSIALTAIPLFSIFLILIKINNTNALFSDRETANSNVLSTATEFQSPTPTPTGSPTPSPEPITKLVINEVYYNPDARTHNSVEEDDPENEWIEIYNPNNADVEFKNWEICDNNDCVTVNPQVSIPALGFALLSRDASTWQFWTIPSGIPQIHSLGGTPLSLANGGDRVILNNPDGVEIDRMSWGSDLNGFTPGCTSTCPSTGDGQSLEREPDGTDTDSAADFIVRQTPTPGL